MVMMMVKTILVRVTSFRAVVVLAAVRSPRPQPMLDWSVP